MPLESMTGYGRGDASNRDVTVTVELRSVNNRFRDLQVRCPREYLALEPRITKVLKAPFTRGRIDAFIRRQGRGSRSVVVSDASLAKQYFDAIEHVFDGQDATVPVAFVLSQPGVLNVETSTVDVSVEWNVVETAVMSAVADLKQMRKNEGQALYEDLQRHLADARRCIAELEGVTTGVNNRIRQRLEGRIRRMLGDRYDANRIIQEAAILADKADVSEEITRLRSHCDQFAEALQTNEPVGRRLDFLLQEMHREVNTIGSKAAEHPISHRVVELKSILERMREQSANVE